MRFIFMIQSAHFGPPSPELMQAVAELADQEIKAGRMVDSGGLTPMAEGALVRLAGGKINVIDGPFAETKEVVGGYAIFELRDKEEAIASAMRFMQLHKNLMPGWEGTCEIRSFVGPDSECHRIAAASR